MKTAELEMISEQLEDRRLTQMWLLKQLLSRGIRTDKATLSRILSGVRGGDKADSVIAATKDIIADYDCGMAAAATRREGKQEIDGDVSTFLERFSRLLKDVATDECCNCLH